MKVLNFKIANFMIALTYVVIALLQIVSSTSDLESYYAIYNYSKKYEIILTNILYSNQLTINFDQSYSLVEFMYLFPVFSQNIFYISITISSFLLILYFLFFISKLKIDFLPKAIFYIFMFLEILIVTFGNIFDVGINYPVMSSMETLNFLTKEYIWGFLLSNIFGTLEYSPIGLMTRNIEFLIYFLMIYFLYIKMYHAHLFLSAISILIHPFYGILITLFSLIFASLKEYLLFFRKFPKVISIVLSISIFIFIFEFSSFSIFFIYFKVLSLIVLLSLLYYLSIHKSEMTKINSGPVISNFKLQYILLRCLLTTFVLFFLSCNFLNSVTSQGNLISFLIIRIFSLNRISFHFFLSLAIIKMGVKCFSILKSEMLKSPNSS